MLKLDYVEFYITNVCNLNCVQCNRFNNYNFSGHSRWKDYAQLNEKWADILDIDTIGILGGEPMANPDFLLWVNGIVNLWPNSNIIIITNGTQLDRWPQLYDVMLTHKNRMVLEINCHNIDSKHALDHSIRNFLDTIEVTDVLMDQNVQDLWHSCYSKIRDPSWPDCMTLDDFFALPTSIQKECHDTHHFSPEIWHREVLSRRIVDRNGVKVSFVMADTFETSTVIYDPVSHGLSLHNSDPSLAMEICHFKKCHHIVKGKLYKCGPTGILPDFIQQLPVSITDTQRNLIESYKPAEVDWSKDRLEEFVDGLRRAVPIPQCSLCPEKMTFVKFKASSKKIKFQRANG